MRPDSLFAFLALGILGMACNSTETGNPHRPRGPSGPTLRSVPLSLALGVNEGSGAPSERRLSGLDLEVTEIEVLDCDDQAVVTSFDQAGSWGSDTKEEAQLPDGASCRVIVRSSPLELGVTAGTSAGAFIEGRTEAGPFKLLAPAPIAAFLEVTGSDTDVTAVSDLRLEVSQERLLEEIERLLALPGNGLLDPSSPETQELSRALERSLELVDGQGEERRVLANAETRTNSVLCDDHCRARDRAGCESSCELSACEDALEDPTCGSFSDAWVSCIARIPSERLSCEAASPGDSGAPMGSDSFAEGSALSDADALCAAARSALDLCLEESSR